MSQTSFVLKGGGWYVDDYGYRKGCGRPKCCGCCGHHGPFPGRFAPHAFGSTRQARCRPFRRTVCPNSGHCCARCRHKPGPQGQQRQNAFVRPL